MLVAGGILARLILAKGMLATGMLAAGLAAAHAQPAAQAGEQRPQPVAVPLPPPRPADLRAVASLPRTAPLPPPDPRRQQQDSAGTDAGAPPAEASAPDAAPPPPAAAGAPATEDACARILASAKAVVKAHTMDTANGGCGVERPVQLEAVVLADGRKVSVDPPAVMRCDLAERVVDWLREDVAAIAAKDGAALARVANAAAYDCRGRNRVAGAKLSEHARGNAIDIRALTLADGREIRIAPRGMAANVASAWRASACARFATVLGPGSDGYHEEHLHVDLAPRRNGLRLCRWTLQ